MEKHQAPIASLKDRDRSGLEIMRGSSSSYFICSLAPEAPSTNYFVIITYISKNIYISVLTSITILFLEEQLNKLGFELDFTADVPQRLRQRVPPQEAGS